MVTFAFKTKDKRYYKKSLLNKQTIIKASSLSEAERVILRQDSPNKFFSKFRMKLLMKNKIRRVLRTRR